MIHEETEVVAWQPSVHQQSCQKPYHVIYSAHNHLLLMIVLELRKDELADTGFAAGAGFAAVDQYLLKFQEYLRMSPIYTNIDVKETI